MRIGVPKEIKPDEYRVALLPIGAEELTRAGHTVLVESGTAWAAVFLTTPTLRPGPRSYRRRKKSGRRPIWSSRSRSRSRPNGR